MTTKTMPDWILAKLIDDGTIPASRLTRTARIRRCRHCNAPTLAGIDGYTSTLDAWTEPVALTTAGEAQAILAGRPTYRLLTGPRLYARDPWSRAAHRADDPPTPPILAAHCCDEPLPDAWTVPGRRLWPDLAEPSTSNDIPY